MTPDVPDGSQPAPVVDHVVQDGRWRFDGQVADVFDDMLRRSIPQYDVMRDTCFTLGSRFVRYKTDVVDLGCSRGEALDPFIRRFGAQCRYTAIECSEPMLAAARVRWKGYIDTGVVTVCNMDLRKDYPPVESSLVLSILTMQFIPIEYRHVLFQRVYEQMLPGGAMILVEKVLGATGALDRIMVDAYLNMKRINGYTEEEIVRKRAALEGVLVPVAAKWNVDFLYQAGFRAVDCFWRWMNFAGWVAVR